MAATNPAIDLLRTHHAQIAHLLESLHTDNNVSHDVISDLFVELRVHSVLEQQVFYPAVSSVLSDEKSRDSEKELYSILTMMLQLEREQDDQERFQQDLATVADQFAHHVHEQEDCIFDEVQNHCSAQDLSTLGSSLQRRKHDVRASMRAGIKTYAQMRCA